MERNRVIVEVSGGVVTAIYASRPEELLGFIVDHDDTDHSDAARALAPIPVFTIDQAEDDCIRKMA